MFYNNPKIIVSAICLCLSWEKNIVDVSIGHNYIFFVNKYIFIIYLVIIQVC